MWRVNALAPEVSGEWLGVLLTGPAPEGGLVLDLTYTGGLWGPATATVPAGTDQVQTPVYGHPTNVRASGQVTASARGLSVRYTWSRPRATATLSVDAAAADGGQSVTVTVAYDVAAGPDGYAVELRSGNPGVLATTWPRVAAGERTATVVLTAASVASATTVTLQTQDATRSNAVTVVVEPAPVGGGEVGAETTPATEEPTRQATPDPTEEPTTEPIATPEPTDGPIADPTATPAPSASPTATPSPTSEPTVVLPTATPSPPASEPTPTEVTEPTAPSTDPAAPAEDGAVG